MPFQGHSKRTCCHPIHCNERHAGSYEFSKVLGKTSPGIGHRTELR